MAKQLRSSRLFILFFVALAGGVATLGCGGEESGRDAVRLNELQLIGTHNSYHLEPPAALVNAIATQDPEFARSIQFSHAPLPQQLDAGIRQLELDVYADPEGGRFAKRVAGELLGIATDGGVDELRKPGFKVLHAPEVDFYSTCWTLKSCLAGIAAWSDAHPNHVPITVFIEAKDEPIEDPLKLGFVQPLPIDAAALRTLDTEILSVFARDRLITPDSIRSSKATLEEAVLAGGWPTLDKAKGKLMFVLLDEGSKRVAYRSGASSLERRVMFTTSSAGQPDAAVIKIDDMTGKGEQIQQLVRSGYLVRILADIETAEARRGDGSRRDAALASGAQFVSTDFPEAVGVATGGYLVRFADGSRMRCNPVTASANCAAVIARLSVR